MTLYEIYKNNLEFQDKNKIGHIKVTRDVLCSNVNILKKNEKETKKKVLPLVASIIGEQNSNFVTDADCCSDPNPTWVDIDRQQKYLNSKPTCYLILGKPGSGSFYLGEKLAETLKCLHICPTNIIIDEISQNSLTGKSLDFNMRHNNVIRAYNLLPIIKQKIKSPVIRHRGYILSGFPLVSSKKSMKCMISSLYGEESILLAEQTLNDIICNLKKSKVKPKTESGEEIPVEEEEENEVEEENDNEEQEKVIELPKHVLNIATDIIHHKKPVIVAEQTMLVKQLNEIFDLEMRPDIVIHLTGPDTDLVTKNFHKYIDVKTSATLVEPFITKIPAELRWPPKYSKTLYESSDDKKINLKYCVKTPIKYTENSVDRMCNYKDSILSLLEDKLKDYDPKHVIKVDARTSIQEVMHQIMERLHLLPAVQPVCIPELLNLEEPPTELDEFWKLVEEQFTSVCNDVPYNYTPSLWFQRCPVELKKRISVVGKTKYGILFMKHVYLLSSLNALIEFYINPRPFLKLQYLEPTCRVFVIGTKSSGKSTVAQCLSWIFEAPVIKYKEIEEIEKCKKYNNFAENVAFAEIKEAVNDNRFQKWQELEDDRIQKLNQWNSKVLNNLTKYIFLFKKYIKLQQQIELLAKMENDEEGNQEDQQSYYVMSEEEEKLVANYVEMRSKLLFLPFIENLQECQKAIATKNLREYAPPSYLKIEAPAIPVLGDEDVTEAIANYIKDNELQNDVQPTPEELVNALVDNYIKVYDKEAEQKSDDGVFYGKYVVDDFPSDPEYWNILANLQYLPDHTIALMENRELDDELIEQYKNLNTVYKYPQERYLLATDPLSNLKKIIQPPPEIDIVDYLKGLAYHIVRFMPLFNEISSENPGEEFVANLTESIEKVKENFDSIKLKLEEDNKSFTDVQLEGKSDVQVIEEVLLYMRKSYLIPTVTDEDEFQEDNEEEDEIPKDLLTYNDTQFLGETGTFCPMTFYKYNVLWEGKKNFFLKFNNRISYFSKEEYLNEFKPDVTRFQAYNKPFIKLPPLRVCVIGGIGSGKTTLSKFLAKELGLIYVNFEDFLNHNLMPRHLKEIGWKYENKFTDEAIDEEAVMENHMGEEEDIEIMPTTNELRLIVYNYFEHCSPLLNHLLQKLIKKLWFEEPFSSTGIVLDGFPRLPSDFEDMIAANCMPDRIIELTGDPETSLNRMSTTYFKVWKSQQIKEKQKTRAKFEAAKRDWENYITRKIVISLTVDEIVNNSVLPDIEDQNTQVSGSVPQKSATDVDDTESDALGPLITLYNELIENFPAPIDTSEWETDEDAQTRIDTRIESIFDNEDGNIQNLKDLLSEQKIKIISIDGTKALEKVKRRILIRISNLRNRYASFFEQTFLLNCDFAEKLLSKGFYFFSKFHRMCPVFIYENTEMVFNIFDTCELDSSVYPVAHRSLIYYIRGEESLIKFRLDPLKYIISSKINSYKEYPLRLGIIGAPKSGKSTLAANLAEKYGLICVSRGIAIRHILEKFYWTKLGKEIIGAMQSGEILSTSFIIEALQTTLIDFRTVTHGFVLDGIPENAEEATELLKFGLYPLLIFDITSPKNFILKNSQNEIYYDILKLKPPYPASFVAYRYSKWTRKSCHVRDYINNDCQNLYLLDGMRSKWYCSNHAEACIKSIIPKINYYLNNVNKTVVPVDVMCISNEIFQKRMSCFKNMCPVCIFNNNLKNNIYPVDKKGVVQYKNQFFWICSTHMDAVLRNPEVYLVANTIKIPEIPVAVKNILVSNIYENGICMVTYAESLPAQKIIRGSKDYAATYRSKVYLFCDQICLEKFIRKPHLYYDITVFKETNLFPSISLKKLPHLGYLEQTVGELLTNACCAVNVLRPKYPGLSISASGSLYIALYLKIHNNNFSKEVIERYNKAFKTYVSRSKLIMDIGLRLRAMDNPFGTYPKCCKIEQADSDTVCKPSSGTQSSSSFSVLMNQN